ncbi:MAG: division/cell wall cluster transcriptional repressor MraZ [Armatimonadota bacterium]
MEEQAPDNQVSGYLVEATEAVTDHDPLAMLQGYSEHSVDDKGRIIIPQRFRDLFGRSCVITRGWNQSLFVFHLSTWRRIKSQLPQLTFTNREAVLLQRFFVSVASEVDIDSQGRLAIPSHLRELADIRLPTAETQSIVVIVGAPYRLEIWSKQVWKDTNAQIEDQAVFEAAATLNVKLEM